jgi:hypothetical protein
MFDVYLREFKDKAYNLVLKNIFGVLTKYKVTPNQITFFSFIMGLIGIYFIYIENKSLAFLFWVLNRFLDGLDGNIFISQEYMLGRLTKQAISVDIWILLQILL